MAKITIVDGNESNIGTIRTILTAKGHKLNFIRTSAELMSELASRQPNMIIISVDLDGADGRELSRMLQTESVYKNIPVILTSPYYHTESEIRSFYCDDLVSLPFDDARLATSVEVLLAKELARVTRLKNVDSEPASSGVS